MKKFLEELENDLLVIILTPVILLIALVGTPIDFIRYRRSAFYRDTHHKYDLFLGTTTWIRLYEIMRRDNLPLDFHLWSTKEETSGYFRCRDTLLVLDHLLAYAPNLQEWLVLYHPDDHEPCTPLSEVRELALENFRQKTRVSDCRRVVLLADINDIPEEDHPHLAECPDILPYDGKKDLPGAIKAWVESMN